MLSFRTLTLMPRHRIVAILTLALATCAPSAVRADALETIDTRIDGLPAGLTAWVALETPCVSPYTYVSWPLAEQSTVTWDTVPDGSGGVKLVQRLHTRYVAQPKVLVPLQTGMCSIAPYVRFHLVVKGENGVRRTQLATSYSLGTTNTLYRTVEAKTAELVRLGSDGLNAGPPTALTRNVAETWFSLHSDTMGADSVVEPALDFLVQTNKPYFGAMARVGRISIARDGKVCVTADAGQVCRTRTEGGTVIQGGIEATVYRTEHKNSGSAYTTWAFRLNSNFPAGPVTVRVLANDLDPFDYLVDNAPATLDLLPWKALSLQVQVN